MADGSTKSGAESSERCQSRIDTYLVEVVEQIKYHSKKSKRYKQYHQILMLTQSAFSLAVTLAGVFLANYGEQSNLLVSCIIGSLGVMLSFTTSLHGIGKFDSQWLHHRNICEGLKTELRVYKACGLVYANTTDEEDRFSIFLSRIENIFIKEHSDWTALQKESNKTRSELNKTDKNS